MSICRKTKGAVSQPVTLEFQVTDCAYMRFYKFLGSIVRVEEEINSANLTLDMK